MSDNAYVIVGGGLAGAKAAQALREEGFTGPLVLIGEESERPYERPPLSKGYLLGKDDRESVYVHAEQWYRDNDIDLCLGTKATSLDTGAHRLTLADGSRLSYGKLLLTTRASPRILPVPGAELAGVHYLRRLADSDRVKAAFQPGARVVVIGAGWIGLEAAAAARTAGAQVTVLESAELPLLRVLGPEVARIFADLHRERGVDMRLRVQVERITGTAGAADAVQLADGTRVEADVILVGIGVAPNTELAAAPNTELAAEAGLAVDNGVVTDEHLQTSVPDVYAAGDVAGAHHPFFGRRIRVEHWANALNQPQIAARSMLGQDTAYDRLPYFFTDQYDLGMEYTGYAESGGYDQVVFRGDTTTREFIAFWLAGGRVVAGMNVNVWDVVEPVQQLIRAQVPVDPSKLADPQTPLESLLVR